MIEGRDGRPMAMLYTRQTELSGNVVPGSIPSPGEIERFEIAANVAYHGGAVQPTAKIYLVFWGTQWNGAGDPGGVRALLVRFVRGLGASSWLKTVTQYTQSDGRHASDASGMYAGSWIDESSIPDLNASDYQPAIAAEASRASAHFGDTTVNANYVIAVPHGVAVHGFAGNYGGVDAYCAWHSDTASSIAYTALPYIPDAGGDCGAGFVNSPGTDDGVSIIGGHEAAETETDPHFDAWYDRENNEIADKCAWKGLDGERFSTGTFPTQPLWSNAAAACVQ